MEEIEVTQEQAYRSISAAYDSVNLVNALRAQGSLTEEEQGILDRNVEHLRVMMEKRWFLRWLNLDQRLEINSIIEQ